MRKLFYTINLVILFNKIKSDKLADIIFSAGSVILNQSAEEIIKSDCKIYKENDISYHTKALRYSPKIQSLAVDFPNQNCTKFGQH